MGTGQTKQERKEKMKVGNGMFSGFAAAILMGTVSANATTPFRVASKVYVDTEISTLSSEDAIKDVATLQCVALD